MINEGSFGKVFIAGHRASGDRRAIKQITKRSVSKRHITEFIAEFELLRNLSHPNIIRVYEIYEDKKHYYIVTEYCEGGELFDICLSREFLNEPVAARIMLQLLSTVKYCHDQNIVHRDLKPENILLEGHPRSKEGINIKVIDFGTSKLFSEKEILKGQEGTPYYMAPEVIQKRYDKRCDLWSCGVILYILLCGQPPFNGEDQRQIFSMILNSRLYFSSQEWTKISAPAKDLVTQLLRKNPDERIRVEDALQHEWLLANVEAKPKVTKRFRHSLSNLKNFQLGSKLKQAISMMITAQNTSKHDRKQLSAAFVQLDTDKDGRLSRQELFTGWNDVFGQAISEQEIDQIIASVDTDNSGFIEFDEFIMAAINKNKLYTKENLTNAFRAFDQDGSGTIDIEEIKKVIGQDLAEDEVWQEILTKADADGSGEIELDEFVHLMRSY